jgi:sortase (surface protein transpeptidase)
MSAVPIRLTIPSLRISAPVVPVGVDATGDMQILARISDVGWYRWGPAPSDGAGSIVLAGHVDSARDGLGAFFTLRAIRAGATITVTLASGQHRTYRVIGPRSSTRRTFRWARCSPAPAPNG